MDKMLPAKTLEKVKRQSMHESQSTGKDQSEMRGTTDVVTGRISPAHMQIVSKFCRYPFLELGGMMVNIDGQPDRI